MNGVVPGEVLASTISPGKQESGYEYFFDLKMQENAWSSYLITSIFVVK